MNQKIWCLLGVHRMQIIKSGPYEKTWGNDVVAYGSYYILQCSCCGTVKRKILCK